MEHSAKNPVKSASTTLSVLEALKELDGAGVTELARHLDLPKSTVHNYLSTLEEDEYVVKEDGGYQVGMRFLEFGTYVRQRPEIYPVARPEVERLADETGELANLLVEEHGRGIYLHRARGDRAVRVDARAGTRVYLHSTALGKAILAHMPDDRVEEIIDRHGLPEITDKTVTDRAALWERLETVRERGYAVDDEERLQGLRCVAAAVQSADGDVLGALSVSAPTNRLRGERFEKTVPAKVKEATNAIELNVTYS